MACSGFVGTSFAPLFIRILTGFDVVGAVISVFLCVGSLEARETNLASRIIADVGYKSALDWSVRMSVCVRARVIVLQIGFGFVCVCVCTPESAHGNGSCT